MIATTEDETRKNIEILLMSLLSNLVDHPESLSIQVNIGESTTIFYINTDQRNLGQIIGSRGRIINSLRTLVGSIAGRNNMRAIIEIPYFEK